MSSPREIARAAAVDFELHGHSVRARYVPFLSVRCMESVELSISA